MDELELLVDLHRRNQRQGPGCATSAWWSLFLSGLEGSQGLSIADLGCGTGAGSIFLAQRIRARVTAIDFLQPFLDELNERSVEMGVADAIETVCAPMDDIPDGLGPFDAIWSEGAIYNIGFENGIKLWRDWLKPKGVVVISEITWLSEDRPEEITTYWHQNYPDIDVPSNKIAQLEHAGYELLGYFPLPKSAWITNYYEPLSRQHNEFLARHNNSDAAVAIIEAEKKERAMYERYSDYYSYGVYIARRTD